MVETKTMASGPIPAEFFGKLYRPQRAGEFDPPLEGNQYVEIQGILVMSNDLYQRIEASRPVLVLKRRSFPMRFWYSYKAYRRRLGVWESLRGAWTTAW